jgi:formylglycine-generating enzyme required for sulfatase activity
VSQITYEQAIDFCRRLSQLAGVPVTLPTEAEWEYACRAGTGTAYSAGSSVADLDRVAWYDGNSSGRVHPVGEKPGNAWGLHDMHGNVWEYCADFFEDPEAIDGTDPVGERRDWRGAMRGGGWMHGAADCRSARRLVSDDMFGGAGLRIRVDTTETGSAEAAR